MITNTARSLQIRQQALTSLRQMESLGPTDSRTAVTVLVWLLNDPDAAVRHAATNALQLIAPEVLQKSSAP
jgi:HEAT repeat protein